MTTPTIVPNTDETTKKAWPLVMRQGDKDTLARPWGAGWRTDVYGNNRACNCAELLKLNIFCVCYGVSYCPNCGHSGCVGGHD